MGGAEDAESFKIFGDISAYSAPEPVRSAERIK
jgi:hypothetical protein